MKTTNIKKKRIEKGLTQPQLAELANVNVRVLQHYEQGSKNIDGAKIETLVSLANALECPLYEILENSFIRTLTGRHMKKYNN